MLVQTGVQYVIVLEGNADILIPGLTGNAAEVVTAVQIIQGHRQMIDRAHALGLRVYGGTLYPVGRIPVPWVFGRRLWKRHASLSIIGSGPAKPMTPSLVSTRCCVIRGISRACGRHDSGDHAHPNDACYKAMADAIDLSLFRDENED